MPHLKNIDGSMRTVSNVPSRKGCLASLVVFALLLLGVTGLLWAETATLTWNANTESDLAGYKLYQGTASGQYGPPVDLGNVTTTTVTLPSLAMDRTYYFAITAYDLARNESGKSNEVNKLIPAVPAPVVLLPPAALRYADGKMSWDAVAGATGGYLLRVHEIGTPYDCSTYLYCNNGVNTLTGTSVMLAFKPGASYDAWIHSMAADGAMSEAQGARFTVPAAPVDVAPSNPTGLKVQ
jgi:hypothetical protein